ncbi:MAG: PEP-CTERM sorting domain-containing protein, partial [Planctomycetales bacterium]|nr:PEP-CTERM sorting domain-containing protein [Planctomycetales bacterium]
DHVEPTPNGWFPRRTTPDGKVYFKKLEGGDDAFWQTSADGLFILQLQAALSERGLADYRGPLKEKTAAFIRAGGIFGSINHDTYDPRENVAYAVAFRTLLDVSRLLKDDAIRTFAYEKCLAGLDQFKMREDRNGVATRGLLIMEKSWDTAYLWENAEAALAYFEAAADTRQRDAAKSREYEIDGLVILRAIAKHHYGPHGFLTEGVDWNNHSGQEHHIDGKEFGAIRYTQPFLNNQHIAEPTLYYLENLACKTAGPDGIEWRDIEGNLILVGGEVPEPSTLVLLTLGLIGLLCYAWRKRKQSELPLSLCERGRGEGDSPDKND